MMPLQSERGTTVSRTEPVNRIAEQIEKVVRQQTGGVIRGLRVEVGDDRVILTGRTTTYYHKQLATHAALAALGELALSNRIEVN